MIHERGIGGWEDNESNGIVATRVKRKTRNTYSAGWVGGNKRKVANLSSIFFLSHKVLWRTLLGGEEEIRFRNKQAKGDGKITKHTITK